MLTEWIVREKQVIYLTVILIEVDEEDDQKTDGGILYKQILINAKLQTGKRGQTFYRADWEKCIMEAKKKDRPCRQTKPGTAANDD